MILVKNLTSHTYLEPIQKLFKKTLALASKLFTANYFNVVVWDTFLDEIHTTEKIGFLLMKNGNRI